MRRRENGNKRRRETQIDRYNAQKQNDVDLLDTLAKFVLCFRASGMKLNSKLKESRD